MTAEDLLTRTLTEVTETAAYPTTPMSTVVSHSRTIRGRRRRRIASVAAAAVVVAGGLSAALLLGHGGDTTPGPAGPLGDFPEGSPPTIDYLDGDAFVTSSGQRVTSPTFGRAAAAVQWGKGVLAASRPTSRDPFSTIAFVSGGLVSRVGCGTPSFVVPADGGDPVYWLSHECNRTARRVGSSRATHRETRPRGRRSPRSERSTTAASSPPSRRHSCG